MGALLSVQDCRVRRNGVSILSDIALEVRSGEVIGLVGANGSGKSTLLRAIVGLTPIESGKIFLDGRSVANMAAHERIRMGMRFLPQSLGVFPSLSVMENLSLMDRWCAGTREGAAAFLERVGLGESALDFPRVGLLSGGQQRLLATAMILGGADDSRLLLLDEPTAGLSRQWRQRLLPTVQAGLRSSGRGVLLVEQLRPWLLGVSDRIVALYQGRIVLEEQANALTTDHVRRAITGREPQP